MKDFSVYNTNLLNPIKYESYNVAYVMSFDTTNTCLSIMTTWDAATIISSSSLTFYASTIVIMSKTYQLALATTSTAPIINMNAASQTWCTPRRTLVTSSMADQSYTISDP